MGDVKKSLTPTEARRLAEKDPDVRVRPVGQGPLCPGLAYGIWDGIELVFCSLRESRGVTCAFPKDPTDLWEQVTKEELEDEYRRDFEQADAALERGGGVSIEPLR